MWKDGREEPQIEGEGETPNGKQTCGEVTQIHDLPSN